MATETSKFLNGILLGSVTLIILTLFLIAGINLFIKRKKLLEEINKRQKEEFETMLLQSQIEIQENTLRNISREIHDNISQVLSLINLNISQIDTEDIFINTKIKNTEALVVKVIQDLRDISKGLNSESINKIGFVKSLYNYIEIVNKSGGKFTIEVKGNERKLVSQTQVILFRMLQECISNAVKHSKATIYSVNLVFSEKNLEILIQDNGIGFDQLTVLRGQGLDNIYKRAKYIEAEVFLNSDLQKGTSIKISVPLND